MGLDLIVEAAAKPGHEAEWRRSIARAFAGETPSDSEVARFEEISIPAYERVAAPRVGFDEAAVDYGRRLLAAAEAAAPPRAAPPKKKGLFAGLFGGKPEEAPPFEEQLDIVRATGRWFVFWGERGHAIRAWS